MSLRPFISPAPASGQEEGTDDEQERTKSMIVSAEDDAVYKWGRNVQVDWKMVTYVTLRDQVRCVDHIPALAQRHFLTILLSP